jgi:murein DD-endopeptidase MepM/ murein hydrolase activator NlpD
MGSVIAQEENQTDGPVYIVQTGDTLWDIAQRFGVSLNDLAQKNQISDPGQVQAGSRLIIPGLDGVEGVLITRPVLLGETTRSLSRQYQVPLDKLERLNHLASPYELYVGSSLILPEPEDNTENSSFERVTMKAGWSLLELAMTHKINPWSIISANDLIGTWATMPGEVLYLPGAQDDGPGALPASIEQIELTNLPLEQGKTAIIRLITKEDIYLTGTLAGYDLHFFPDSDSSLVALQGIHAMIEPGLYSLELSGELPDGTPLGLYQMIHIQDGNYPFDRPLTVDPTTLDPDVTGPEDAQWASLSTPITPDRLWSGVFQFPSPLPADYCLDTGECWSSRFGNRRSYNGGPYNHFHTGLDIVGKVGREIYAPAPGIVVFSDEMTVRGKATMINHGWGVYTAYMHQSEILAFEGQRVETGQLIGLVGNTGRVEGPHLHWEVIVGGVQVDPLEWLQMAFP